MVEFNTAFHASLVFGGYRYILYHNMEHYGLLHPLKLKAPKAFVKKMGACQLRITDDEVLEMANGTTYFQFYIADDILETETPSYVLSRK